MGKKHYSDTKKQSFHNSLILMLILFLSLGIVLVQSFSCLEANSFTEGLVAHYPMDEGKGSTILDHSGNGNDGTIHGAMWVEGKFGRALSFDGKSSYVEVPDSPSLDITDEITIAMWIKVNALPGFLEKLMTGYAGEIQITQGFLLVAVILLEIPIAMIFLSRVLKYRANRWANIIAGTIMTAVQIVSLFVATPTMYYIFFSAIEITCTALIVWYAWKWPNTEV